MPLVPQKRLRTVSPIVAGAALFALVLAAALLAAAVPAWAQGKVGTITAVKGEATLTRDGRDTAVTAGMAVHSSDKLTTRAGANLTVTFGDNSRLIVSEASSIVINEGTAGGNSSIHEVGLRGGRLRSIINSTLRSVSPVFEVRTPNAIVGVRGTVFETAYIEGKPCPGFPDCLRYTDVGVYRGRVEVSNLLNPKARPVIAGAGYETTVPCEQPPASPSPLGMSEMMSPAYR